MRKKSCNRKKIAVTDLATGNADFKTLTTTFLKKRNLAKKVVAQVRSDAVNMKFDWGKLRNTLTVGVK